ncbi:MAG: acyl-CoA reductase, partial [bacterium]
MDGFWAPRAVRAALVSERTEWEALSFAGGRQCGLECDTDTPGAVSARWPRLTPGDWRVLLDELAAGRDRAPQGAEFWSRLQVALIAAGHRLADPSAPARATILGALAGYTGYSPAMVASIMGAPEMWDMQQMRSALASSPTRTAIIDWEPLQGLPGLLRFFPGVMRRGGRARARGRVLEMLAGGVRPLSSHPHFAEPVPPGTVVGYGAGNVPGTALIIALLSLATTLVGRKPPVVVIRNSRREPIFSPLVLAAIEEADPDLLASVAILVWDYDDDDLQRRLLAQADLVIAAAGDETIDRLASQIASATSGAAAPEDAAPEDAAPEAAASENATSGAGAPGNTGKTRRAAPRFHAHGHKVSFSAISREMFEDPEGRSLPSTLQNGQDLLDAVAFLAALDSSFW